MQPRGFTPPVKRGTSRCCSAGRCPRRPRVGDVIPKLLLFILRFALSALFFSSSRYVQALALGRFYFGRSRGLIFLPVSRADRYNARTLRGGPRTDTSRISSCVRSPLRRPCSIIRVVVFLRFSQWWRSWAGSAQYIVSEGAIFE